MWGKHNLFRKFTFENFGEIMIFENEKSTEHISMNRISAQPPPPLLCSYDSSSKSEPPSLHSFCLYKIRKILNEEKRQNRCYGSGTRFKPSFADVPDRKKNFGSSKSIWKSENLKWVFSIMIYYQNRKYSFQIFTFSYRFRWAEIFFLRDERMQTMV